MDQDDEFHRLPEHVTVPLDEVRVAVSRLEAVLRLLEQRVDAWESVRQIDDVVGLMTRWLWPLLRELDEENGL